MPSNRVDFDFCIRCLPEDVTFAVQKTKLVEGSEVFSDMFSCCDNENDDEGHRRVDIYESASDVALLVQLLHTPPSAVMLTQMHSRVPRIDYGSSRAIIPHPLLPRLFILAEKYALTSGIMKALHTHLAAQASVAPLLVYGIATRFSLPEIADSASTFLVSPPMETYSTDEIKVIPSTEAYHKLLLLQNHRKLKMKELLMNEELFPHGYGACGAHRDWAETMWDERRKVLSGHVDSGTDVTTEMVHGLDARVRRCKVCLKAWVAATDMLAYKCEKVARRISQLPRDDNSGIKRLHYSRQIV